ncbi:hypothetical protein II582_03475 [bacterium]|nr:hypothetical protein [bacterium]
MKKAQSTNNKISLNIYKINQDHQLKCQSFINKLKIQKRSAHQKTKSEKIGIESFLFLNKRYASGGTQETKAAITVDQFFQELNISL